MVATGLVAEVAVSGGVERYTLELTDSETTRAWWPVRFAAQLTVVLGAGSLRVQLVVHNTGNTDDGAWDFTTALHTYLRVEDVGRARLGGLDGCARWDALTYARGVQQGLFRPLHLGL